MIMLVWVMVEVEMRAIPKSTMRGRFSESIRMLAGLMSRWTTPFLWAISKPSATCSIRLRISSRLNFCLECMRSSRLEPSTYSMAM